MEEFVANEDGTEGLTAVVSTEAAVARGVGDQRLPPKPAGVCLLTVEVGRFCVLCASASAPQGRLVKINARGALSKGADAVSRQKGSVQRQGLAEPRRPPDVLSSVMELSATRSASQ